MLNTGGNLLYKTLAQVIVHIQFRIPCNLYHVGGNGFIFEHGKNIAQAIPDQIVQDYDVIFITFLWKYHKSIHSFWNLDKSKPFFLFPIIPLDHHFYGQISGRIL